jgi:hypothetical protein
MRTPPALFEYAFANVNIPRHRRIRMRLSNLWAHQIKLGILVLLHLVLSVVSFAQSNVEIELAGPWSYVQDPADQSRIVVIAPVMGHKMAVFTGENAYVFSNPLMPSAGAHRLDFGTAPCNSPTTGEHPLYAIDGVAQQTITDALTSPNVYVLNLPKPCSYQINDKSRFKFNPAKPVTGSSQEQIFATWMILGYNASDPSNPSDFDKTTANASKIPFGSNAGTNKKAISAILFVDPGVDPDQKCDTHSGAIFDSILTLWKAPHVYRIFPGIIPAANNSNSNTQTNSYDYKSCSQTMIRDEGIFMSNQHQHEVSSNNGKAKSKSKMLRKAPGRADCHAAQVNVNGVVD